jgi:hypothetical protein
MFSINTVFALRNGARGVSARHAGKPEWQADASARQNRIVQGRAETPKSTLTSECQIGHHCVEHQHARGRAADPVRTILSIMP